MLTAGSMRGRQKRQLPMRLLAVAALFSFGAVYSLLFAERDAGAPATGRHLLENYPPNALTDEQIENGGFVLYLVGVVYMFFALAIVCDEFFVPALEVITEKLEISEDVAGATFMAAGGSAPELFTSFIGTFIAVSDVGLGTIVGSAVFNVLFVIGMCAVLSKEVLDLTWWPLFRDSLFYSIDLILLTIFFVDGQVDWYESLILLLMYAAYVIFMKYNAKIEYAVKEKLQFLQRAGTRKRRDTIFPNAKGFTAYRQGTLQLLFDQAPPLSGSDRFHNAAQTVLAAHRSNQAESKADTNTPLASDNVGDNTTPSSTTELNAAQQSGEVSQLSPAASGSQRLESIELKDGAQTTNQQGRRYSNLDDTVGIDASEAEAAAAANAAAAAEQAEHGGLSMKWPKSPRARFFYVILLPLAFPLYWTLPNVSKPRLRHWYPWTFIGSILWIGAFSYLMVWWATVAGEALGIPPAVMGLTILAAGTSVPDLMTSVIVARHGFGDMAVSSSIGSNIFDVTVGLPLPWIFYSIAKGPYQVISEGLRFSVFVLFVMLALVIGSICASRWRLSKPLGISMFVLYGLFVLVSLLIEYDQISPPF